MNAHLDNSTTETFFSKTDGGKTKPNAIKIPSISLPRAGGAVKGIDEKFKVNPANGTASFTIPLPFSPNRNQFNPSLSLSYNSGSGNNSFGLGWELDLPSIQRKTDKGLPRYLDSNNSDLIDAEDTYMFSGYEDLVPLIDFENDKWKINFEKSDGFIKRQYRPRVETDFTRIERIFHNEEGFYWRVTTKENITTFFGFTKNCRITDPNDETKTFKWLPEFSFDSKGSCIWYEYKGENLIGVDNYLHEKNRFNNYQSISNKYLKRIKYCNSKAYYIDEKRPYEIQFPQVEETETDHHFELVLDYGEHNLDVPTPKEEFDWKARKDAFSTYRAGFEIRNYRLCSRILMFHKFPELNNGNPTLVRSLDFEHSTSNEQAEQHILSTELTYLTGITQKGYVIKEGKYSSKSLPQITFDYHRLNWNTDVKEVSRDNLAGLPVGLSENYQWVDLYSEGVSGILTEQANGWFYKSNLGVEQTGEIQFSTAKAVIPKPSFYGLNNGVLQLQDLEADGKKQIVITTPGTQGFFELMDDGEWSPFKTFIKTLNLDLRDPNVRMLDLNGDGKPDIILSNQGAFWWWKNQGKIGYDSPELAAQGFNEEKDPAILFADQEQSIFLADMSGDGLTDIVRIRNGEICYWANMGYGRFSAKITMSNSPVFDSSDQFNLAYLRLADISGTGATDIIYLGKNKFQAFINYSGNSWSNRQEIEPFFPTEEPNKITVTDLLGNGTACIVWSSELPAYQNAPMKYIDLMGGIKPHILKSYENGLGKKTEIEYRSSTHFYLQDKINASPWITKLAFPVQCVSKVIVTENITKAHFTTAYSYHHGYYDHKEREFRGFGRVEQTDAEAFEIFQTFDAGNTVTERLFQPPILTKTWYHTGAFFEKENILKQFKSEYWIEKFKQGESTDVAIEYELPDAIIQIADSLAGKFEIDSLSADEYREAFRACKGMILRQEVFGLDRTDQEAFDQNKKQLIPYNVTSHNYSIQLIQPQEQNRHAAFAIKQRESIDYNYECNPADPRIIHTLNLKIDDLGNVLETATIAYGRNSQNSFNDPAINQKVSDFAHDIQQKILISFAVNDFTNDLISQEQYLLRRNWQVRTFEITGVKSANNIFTVAELNHFFDSAAEIEYFQQPVNDVIQKRLIEHLKTNFYDAELALALTDGKQGKFGITYESYQLAYTRNLINDIFQKNDFSADVKITDADLNLGKFVQFPDDKSKWWIGSGRIQYLDSSGSLETLKDNFFNPIAFIDEFGSITEVHYDSLRFYVEYSLDALKNKTKILTFNFRTLSPVRIQDINDNISSVILDELGLVKAIAIEGKNYDDTQTNTEADNLGGLSEQTEDEQNDITSFFTISQTADTCNYAQLQNIARQLLKNASTRLIYDFTRQPSVAASIVRERHSKQTEDSPLQISFEYTDGLGRAAMKKNQAEAGEIKSSDGKISNTGKNLRWVGSGRTIFNNKGNPVKQYEPYFSVTPAFEIDQALVETGVSSTLYYDAASRLIKTELPNGTFSKVIFNAWEETHFDVNDTVKNSNWYKNRIELDKNDPERKSAQKTEIHDDTPLRIISDNLGRPFLSIEHNRLKNNDPFGPETKDEFIVTHSELDIEGNNLSVTDSRGNVVMQYRYDMLGNPVAQTSMDAGRRWMFNNSIGNPVKTWDERRQVFSFDYDELHRPISKSVKRESSENPIGLISDESETSIDLIYERVFYGETLLNDPTLMGKKEIKDNNLRGKIFVLYDTAGKITSNQYDFKGNLLESERVFAKNYKNTPNWSVSETDELKNAFEKLNEQLEEKDFSFTTKMEFDALNRQVKQIAPDRSEIFYTFNPAGLLETVGMSKDNLYVKNIDYNAKGQRAKVAYGNGVVTEYKYDADTFRLISLKTIKSATETLQNLNYTYDPIGNIIQIEDKAIPTIFYNNQQVEGKSQYTYDALYRLIEASGREQSTNPPIFGSDDNWNDNQYLLSYPTDSKNSLALQNYTQQYNYDSVGNIQEMNHIANGNSLWKRSYKYEEKNNRLVSTKVGVKAGGNVVSNEYKYSHHNQHGYMTTMPHLQKMAWTFKEELQATSKQLVTKGTPEITYYVYDGNGHRVRKVTENSAVENVAPSLKNQRIYIGGFEVYRDKEVERNTLHIMDDKSRVAMVDTETQSGNSIVRYQLGNHLDSVNLEVDENGIIINYEEFHPYGTTSYQARNKVIIAAAKRYRYTAMERDDETGLSYHSARYYIPWLGRWCSADPIDVKAGVNFYSYVKDNPIIKTDMSGKYQESFEINRIKIADSDTSKELNSSKEINNKSPLIQAKDKILDYKPLGQGLSIAHDTLKRIAYFGKISEESQQIVGQIRALALSKTVQNLNKAEKLAKEVSTFRNVARTATQEQLTFGGKLLSKALEKEHDFATIFKSYGNQRNFETFENIAQASGRSNLAVTRLGMITGSLTMTLGVSLSANRVYKASPENRSKIIAEEVAATGGGVLGTSLGTAGGVELAGIIALGLGASSPPGWLVLGLSAIGGGIVGYVGSEGGKSTVNNFINTTKEIEREAEIGINKLYGVPNL